MVRPLLKVLVAEVIMLVTTIDPAVPKFLELIRAEYTELPGLNLTGRQFERMWSLDRELCGAVLEELVNERFLRQTADGEYVLAETDW